MRTNVLEMILLMQYTKNRTKVRFPEIQREAIHMTNEEYKKFLHNMIEKISNNAYLEKIYRFVHYYFLKS